eukprot:m.5805 g.5805  ORF g.5805 m.5805 type:complete len:127 (-) comp7958_c0_seq1:42-422(-)
MSQDKSFDLEQPPNRQLGFQDENDGGELSSLTTAIRAASLRREYEKLFAAWPEVKAAFLDVYHRHPRKDDLFVAMTMRFCRMAVDEARDLFDETEEREEEWSAAALMVRDLLTVYEVWVSEYNDEH